MIYPVLGLQSPLTHWCSQVVLQLVRMRDRSALKFHADVATDVLRHLLVAEASSVITMSRPDRVVRDAILGSGRAYVMSTASPRASVAYLAHHHGFASIDATRGVLGDVASLLSLVESNRRLVVLPEHATGRAAETVSRIASHFGLTCNDGIAATIAADCAAAFSPDELTGAVEFDSELDLEERRAVHGALDGLNHALVDGSYDKVVAARRFFTADVTGAAPLEPIDATGRNRLLIYGPFLALPAGDWTARCVYSFSEGLVGTPMTVDVIHFSGALVELARTSFAVTAPGRLDVNVRFQHVEPSAVLEVRLFSDRAIFDGTISLGFVEFSRNRVAPHSTDEVQKIAELA